jgi:predicted RNase H-like HicB family nuclease
MRTDAFKVVIEQDEDGRFLAICPALPGCYTEGETEAEARELIHDAIKLHIAHGSAKDDCVRSCGTPA